MIKLKYGTTRTCLLVGNVCLKFPTLQSWRLFLHGLLGNMQEATFEKINNNNLLCPIKFKIWGGFLVVMERAHVDLTSSNNLDQWIESVNCNPELSVLHNIVEHKYDSIGKLKDGRIVVVDYG